jgi:hypothetical protein
MGKRFIALFVMMAFGIVAVYGHDTAHPVGIYDPDPQHIWNRVYRQFYIRVADNGTEFGADTLDPLLWYETESLLKAPTYQQTSALLDDFLNVHAENLITDPLKRALFQRDLWAVFDWLSWRTDTYTTERQELQKRVAQIMRRVALTDAQIAALPQNYSAAVSSHQFADQYSSEPSHPAFLPPDLMQPNSAWVEVGSKNEIIAITHTQAVFNGRSVFHVFYHLPTGRQATLDFIAGLNASQTTHQIPSLPENTSVALVRQLLLINSEGHIVPTPITESVQFRVLQLAATVQNVYGFRLSRVQLIAGKVGGLYSVGPDDKEFPVFMDHGLDAFETKAITIEQAQAVTLQMCQTCHFGQGAGNIISYSRDPFPRSPKVLPVLTETNPDIEANLVISWKQQQANWQTLHKYWLKG